MPGKKLSPQDLEHFAAQLKLMLGVLSGDIESLAADAQVGQVHSDAQGDEGDGYYADLSLQLMQHDENTALEVSKAMQRIEEGTFGRCADCEHWLLKDRLRAMPHAQRCIECQRKAEASPSSE